MVDALEVLVRMCVLELSNPPQGLPSLIVLFPSGHSLFFLRVMVHLFGRVFEKFDESYCFWLFILWDVFLL